jgi:hypothetical protein
LTVQLDKRAFTRDNRGRFSGSGGASGGAPSSAALVDRTNSQLNALVHVNLETKARRLGNLYREHTKGMQRHGEKSPHGTARRMVVNAARMYAQSEMKIVRNHPRLDAKAKRAHTERLRQMFRDVPTALDP